MGFCTMSWSWHHDVSVPSSCTLAWRSDGWKSASTPELLGRCLLLFVDHRFGRFRDDAGFFRLLLGVGEKEIAAGLETAKDLGIEALAVARTGGGNQLVRLLG